MNSFYILLNMKTIKKYHKTILIFSFVLALSIYVCLFAIKKARDVEIYKQNTIQTKIYEIWHIETFEGGGKSRTNYLKDIALNIEKSNPSILFMVRQISPEKLASELDQARPDIISFGYGVGTTILPFLKEFNQTYEVRSKLIDSGTFNKKLFAIPYILSGYAEISHNAQFNQTIYSKSYTNPSPNLNYSANALNISQYEAYKRFVNDKSIRLIGTGRDVYRVNNLNNIGRTNAQIKALSVYTDLIQYIGICNTDENISNFVSLALSGENQLKLIDYSLFSSKYGKIYSTGIYNDMEDAIISASVPNCFENGN